MFFIALFVACGVAMIVAGRELAPSDSVAAQTFRADPSCGSNLAAVTKRGACSVVTATVLVAEMRQHGFGGRTRPQTAFVALRFADGTFHDGQLVGSAGDVFVESVQSGAPARAQLFGTTLVRVASSGITAETADAPDYSADTDSEMPWVGVVLILVALLIFAARLRTVRRAGG